MARHTIFITDLPNPYPRLLVGAGVERYRLPNCKLPKKRREDYFKTISKLYKLDVLCDSITAARSICHREFINAVANHPELEGVEIFRNRLVLRLKGEDSYEFFEDFRLSAQRWAANFEFLGSLRDMMPAGSF